MKGVHSTGRLQYPTQELATSVASLTGFSSKPDSGVMMPQKVAG